LTTTSTQYRSGVLDALDAVDAILSRLPRPPALAAEVRRLRATMGALPGGPEVEPPEDPLDNGPEPRRRVLDEWIRTGSGTAAPDPEGSGVVFAGDLSTGDADALRGALAFPASVFAPETRDRSIRPGSPVFGAFPRPDGDPLDFRSWNRWTADGWTVRVRSFAGGGAGALTVQVWAPSRAAGAPPGPPVLTATGRPSVQVPDGEAAVWGVLDRRGGK
jgi:hypothetical protein